MPPPVLRLDVPGADTPAPESQPAARVAPGTQYVVEPGDSLWAIACRTLRAATGTEPTSAEVDAFWPRIYEANRNLIGGDPDLIHPGQRLVLPAVQEA